MMHSVDQCHLIEFPRISDPRGHLTFIENAKHLPFAIQRVYYLYEVPEGSERGGHAHRRLHQVLIALSGSFEIVLDDGFAQRTLRLHQANQGLYLCPMIWRVIRHFSAHSLCLVLASDPYEESDYYREYPEFEQAARSHRGAAALSSKVVS